MKFKVLSEVMAAALDKISAALENKAGEKEAYLKVRAEVLPGGMLKLYSGSRYIKAEAVIECEDAEGPIIFSCSGKLLRDIVSSLPPCSLLFSVAGTSISIKTPTGVYKLNFSSENSLLPPVNFDNFKYQEISLGSFLYALNRVSFCTFRASPDRSYKEGVFINDKHFVATDGFRLAMFTNLVCPAIPPVLIKADTVYRIQKLFKGCGDSGGIHAELDGNGRAISLALSSGNLRSQISLLHEETYPPYASAIPSGTHSTCTIDKAILCSALERIILMADKGNSAKFIFSGNSIRVETSVESIGGGHELIPCQSGLEQEMRFSVKAFLEGVRHCEKEAITLEVRGPSSPLVIKEGGYANVIMPIRATA